MAEVPIFLKMEDDLNTNFENEKRAQIFDKRRLPQFFENGRQLIFFKWTTISV